MRFLSRSARRLLKFLRRHWSYPFSRSDDDTARTTAESFVEPRRVLTTRLLNRILSGWKQTERRRKKRRIRPGERVAAFYRRRQRLKDSLYSFWRGRRVSRPGHTYIIDSRVQLWPSPVKFRSTPYL